jgi:hypothetical protein
LATIFPIDDLVLPSLWHAAGGLDAYTQRDASGEFVRWVEPMSFVWETKSALPASGLACGGNHLRGRATLVSLAVLPALVAATDGRDDLDEGEREVVAAVRDVGPVSTRELPELLAQRERKAVRASVARLQRRLVLTNVGLEDTARWPAAVVDLVDRHYSARLAHLPSREEARRALARRLLDTAGELSAVDLGAVFGWGKRESARVLDELGLPAHEERGVRVWRSEPPAPP